MDLGLKDRAVLVTGAASGIGRATALAFAEAGARVFAVDLNPQGLAETKEMAGTGIATFEADLSKAQNCAPVIEKAVSELGHLDSLCNVAGVLRIQPVEDVTPEIWDLTFAVNVRAPFFLSKAAIPHLLARGGGTIVNISSATAFRGYAYMAAYTSSKAAIAQMTRSMATEFLKEDIRINAIAPGAVNTPMGTSADFSEKIDFDLMMRGMGLREGSDPSDLTDMILYLSSPLNRIFHGTCLHTDNGFTAG